jgi:hypothetical protein
LRVVLPRLLPGELFFFEDFFGARLLLATP